MDDRRAPRIAPPRTLLVPALALALAVAACRPAIAEAGGQVPAAPGGPTTDHVRHVRAGGRGEAARRLLTEAERLSRTIEDLSAALDRTDVVAIVEVASRAGDAPAAMYFVGAGHGVRWVRIAIDSSKIPLEQVGLLAHELQHASELAAAPDVTCAAGLAALYRRIGYLVADGAFETTAARETERQALADVGVRRPLTPR